MLSEDEKREIREVIRECFSAFLSEQGLSVAKHSAQHTYIENLQETSHIIKKASYWTLASTLIAAVLWAIMHKG